AGDHFATAGAVPCPRQRRAVEQAAAISAFHRFIPDLFGTIRTAFHRSLGAVLAAHWPVTGHVGAHSTEPDSPPKLRPARHNGIAAYVAANNRMRTAAYPKTTYAANAAGRTALTRP